MQKLFKNELKNFNEQFLKKCFATISNCCSTQSQGLLKLGSHGIQMGYNESGEYVPFLIPIWNKEDSPVELYSEDGYPKLEDIAHWTDICVDAIMSKAAGIPEYNSQWNVDAVLKEERRN